MRTAAATLTIFVALGVMLAGQRPTFSGGVISVTLDVSVKRDGKSVTGLTAGDFQVTDRGVPQTIAEVSREQLPIDVTFIPDLVGTTEGPWLAGFRRAFETMRRGLRREDKGRLVLFDPRIREINGIEEGPVEITSVNPSADGGASSLIDTVAVSLVRDANPEYRRMAVVLTDGQDGGSFLDETELMEVAGRTDVAVFVVAMTDGTTSVPQRPTNERMLRLLAETTGGAVTIVQRDADLGASFIRELEEFRTSYVVRYTPVGVTGGGWHDVEVKLNRPGRFEVRARKGYISSATSVRQ